MGNPSLIRFAQRLEPQDVHQAEAEGGGPLPPQVARPATLHPLASFQRRLDQQAEAAEGVSGGQD